MIGRLVDINMKSFLGNNMYWLIVFVSCGQRKLTLHYMMET